MSTLCDTLNVADPGDIIPVYVDVTLIAEQITDWLFDAIERSGGRSRRPRSLRPQIPCSSVNSIDRTVALKLSALLFARGWRTWQRIHDRSQGRTPAARPIPRNHATAERCHERRSRRNCRGSSYVSVTAAPMSLGCAKDFFRSDHGLYSNC